MSTTRRYAALLLCAAFAAFEGAALAAPALSVKTHAIEATVEIDPALDRFKPLKNHLLAQAERDVGAQRREAEETKRAEPRSFRRRWTFERRYTFISEAGPFVSVRRIETTYTGGAHPNTVIATIIWDNKSGGAVGLDAFLNDVSDGGPTLTALAGLVRDSLAVEKRKRGVDVAENAAQDEWLRAVEPKLDTLGAPALTRSAAESKASGLSFYFSPYDVGPYVEGAYTAFVSGAALKPYLKADKAALFDGAPAAAGE
ncbi:MAG: DUF4163 domain-containing protein [Variibacter sp.]